MNVILKLLSILYPSLKPFFSMLTGYKEEEKKLLELLVHEVYRKVLELQDNLKYETLCRAIEIKIVEYNTIIQCLKSAGAERERAKKQEQRNRQKFFLYFIKMYILLSDLDENKDTKTNNTEDIESAIKQITIIAGLSICYSKYPNIYAELKEMSEDSAYSHATLDAIYRRLETLTTENDLDISYVTDFFNKLLNECINRIEQWKLAGNRVYENSHYRVYTEDGKVIVRRIYGDLYKFIDNDNYEMLFKIIDASDGIDEENEV